MSSNLQRVTPAALRGQPSQQALQRQSPVDRRVERGLELTHAVHQLEQLPYIQNRRGALASGGQRPLLSKSLPCQSALESVP